jgi:hypothetical protein
LLNITIVYPALHQKRMKTQAGYLDWYPDTGIGGCEDAGAADSVDWVVTMGAGMGTDDETDADAMLMNYCTVQC